MCLDIDESFVVARELIRRGGRVALGRYNSVPSLGDLVKDPSLRFKDAGVVINIPTQAVFFRNFPITLALSRMLKLKNAKARDKELMTFIVRQNLPIRLDECYWSIFILNESLNLLAARKEIVERYVGAVETLGLRVAGVIPSVVALYNIFIYNFPKNKSRFAFLNIRNTSSDMVIHEAGRLWIYPISIGAHVLRQDPSASDKFALEIQRALNSYYMQNTVKEKSLPPFYLSGQDLFSSLAFSLKKTMGEAEFIEFDCFKNVMAPKDSKVNRPESTLSLGLGISYFRMAQTINANLIREKLLKLEQLKQIKFFKKISIPLMLLSAAILVLVDINLVRDAQGQSLLYQKSKIYVSKMLPELKLLKADNEKYQKPLDFLRSKLNRQVFFLKALAVVSESRLKSVEIKEFSAEVKDGKLQVLLSGIGPSYTEINEFLSNIKKNEEIKETKLIASSTAGESDSGEPINFKLRFEMPLLEEKAAASAGSTKGAQGAQKR
jgi:Tfp pilus assembly PilM family ATPase